MHIYLIGYMGAGKSTAGARLAKRLGLEFVDLDNYIEHQQGVPIPGLISGSGEEHFRLMEHRALAEVSGWEPHVVATGGGAPCFHDNMKLMNDTGITIYLRLHPDSLYKRLSETKNPRPILDGLQGEALRARIMDQLAERETYYLKARLVVKGESLDMGELSRKITELTG